MYKKYIKRLLDIILSLIGIIVLSPILLILYILVLIFMGFPAIFKQERPGKNEKIFHLFKFRTMTNKKDKDGKLLPDEKRLTKFGKFLRKTSLDELPELFNILIGQMSFIGPRPLIDEGVDHLTIEYRKQNGAINIRPGITGLAQINGRVNASPEKKSEYDAKYYQKLSMWLDIKIFFITIFKTLTRKDIFDEGTENEK